MSASSPPNFGASGGSKKAVHVKWAGKTIALGTFPASEADEKCARAKALTRAWRSTMRPKPSRDWVMMELERLGVRVVSGRLGRKAGEDEEESKKGGGGSVMGGGPHSGMGWGDGDLNNMMVGARRGSMGLSSMLNDGRRGSLGSLGQMVGLDSSGDPSAVGRSMGGFDLGDPQRRSSGLGGIGGLAGAGLGGMGMSVNPNQHYEMLKLHHMNLLNEIQETTLMMNLYQQQQLQQQQQQLQQQANAEGLGNNDQLSMSMLQNQQSGNIDQMFGGQMGQMGHQQRGSLGLGASHLGGSGIMGNFNAPSSSQSQQVIQQAQQSSSKEAGAPSSLRAQEPAPTASQLSKSKEEPDDDSDEDEDEKEAKNLVDTIEESGEIEKKRAADEQIQAPEAKKQKTEESATATDGQKEKSPDAQVQTPDDEPQSASI